MHWLVITLLVACLYGNIIRADENLGDEVSHPGFSDAEYQVIKESEENYEFEAEVSRLMDIIINALYSNRDIFLRELISNAADALDKIRFLSVSDASLLGEGETANLEIKISFDREAKTITIRDRGVGMTKADLIKNLGVVAKSGTTDFVEAATAGGDALSLIGQFGVGFYSVYLVADKVVVASKHNDDEQYLWESNADRTFSVAKDPRGNTLGRGTSITLHIKEDAEEYLNDRKMREIVGRYSEFVNFPIYLEVENTVEEEVPLTEEELAELEEEEQDEALDLDISEEEDEDEEKEAAPKTKTVKKQVKDWERLNSVKAIWTRSPSEVEDEEYEGFYRALVKAKDGDDDTYLTKTHFSAEGEISFRSLLYVPKKAPADLYDNYYGRESGVKLYVRRVLISDEFDDFLPGYLSFIKGVVDSEDLPINVSRETLAQSRVLRVMSKKLVRKVLDMLRKMAQKEEDYLTEKEEAEDRAEQGEDVEEIEEYLKYSEFWKEFGKSIRLGLIEDQSNQSKLTKLLRFPTNLSPETPISLDRYVDGMAEGQDEIYYITGQSVKEVQDSPYLEAITKMDYEVLFLVDTLDEYVSQRLNEYEGFKFVSITKEGLKLGDEEKAELYEKKFEAFSEWLKDILGKKVRKVVVSPRLATTPAIIVTGQYGWSANMERIMKAQTFRNAEQESFMSAKKTLEINPKHSIIRELAARVAEDPESEELKNYAELIFDAALLQSGFYVEETNAFAKRLHTIVGNSMDVELELVEVEIEEVEEDDEDDEEVDVVLD